MNRVDLIRILVKALKQLSLDNCFCADTKMGHTKACVDAQVALAEAEREGFK
jgi:hypothetical protein